MTTIEKYNNLDGKEVSRQYIENLNNEAFDKLPEDKKNIKIVWQKTSNLLADFPDADRFIIEIVKPLKADKNNAKGGLKQPALQTYRKRYKNHYIYWSKKEERYIIKNLKGKRLYDVEYEKDALRWIDDNRVGLNGPKTILFKKGKEIYVFDTIGIKDGVPVYPEKDIYKDDEYAFVTGSLFDDNNDFKVKVSVKKLSKHKTPQKKK